MKSRYPIAILAGLCLSAHLTTASAACNPTKDFMLGYAPSGDYRIFVPPGAIGDIGSSVIKGRFWQAGHRAAANESGDCPEATYLYQVTPSEFTIFGQSGGDLLGTGPCANQGCVIGDMIILVQTLSELGDKAYYAGGKISENLNGHDYSRSSTDWFLTEIPRPQVVSSQHDQGVLTLNLKFDPPNGVHGEADGYPRSSILTGYQLMRFEGMGDPGRDPAMWTNEGSVIPVSETGATVNGVGGVCPSSSVSAFFAVRPVFDSGQLLGDYVGASMHVDCNILAEPRFNSIGRPKSGRNMPRSNPR